MSREARSGLFAVAEILIFAAALLSALAAHAQEVQLERCDKLLLIPVTIGEGEHCASLRFLVDTAATTILNVKSFEHLQSADAKHQSLDVTITSWNGTLGTSARQVALPENTLIGSYRLDGLKLPAVDLSPIGKACGKRVDGIAGADLLERMGATINLEKQIAHLATVDDRAEQNLATEMQRDMHPCLDAFNAHDESKLAECFDPKIVMYANGEDLRGREQVIAHLHDRYFRSPESRFASHDRNFHRIGEALWYEYDFTITNPQQIVTGRGMAMCHRSEGHWRIASMHSTVLDVHKLTD